MSRADDRRNGGLEIVIEQDDPLEDHFKSLPNALLRGELDDKYDFDFRGYTLRERAMLAALLSNAKRYRCTRARIEALAPELGPDGLDTVLGGLKAKGHLRTTRVNDPDSRGKFVWRWQVSLRPMPAASAKPAGQSMGGLATDGPATDGPAMDGQAGSKYLRRPGVKKTTSPNPRSGGTPPQPAQVQEGEEAPPEDQQPPAGAPPGWPGEDLAEAAALRAVLTAAQRRQLPRRRAGELADLIKERLAAGWTTAQVVDVLGEPLDGVDSVYATLRWRITNLLDGPPPPPAPAPRQRDPDGPPPGSLAAAAACRRCSPSGWVEHPETAQPLYRCDHTQPDAEVAA